MITCERSHVCLGKLLVTPAALSCIVYEGYQPEDFLTRHARGDWGVVSVSDRLRNEDRLLTGGRIVSAYRLAPATIWVLTEQRPHRTTIMLWDELPG